MPYIIRSTIPRCWTPGTVSECCKWLIRTGRNLIYCLMYTLLFFLSSSQWRHYARMCVATVPLCGRSCHIISTLGGHRPILYIHLFAEIITFSQISLRIFSTFSITPAWHYKPIIQIDVPISPKRVK